MNRACFPLVIFALTACSALSNSDKREWADGVRLPAALPSPGAEFQPAPVATEAPAALSPSPLPPQASSPRSSKIWLYLGGRSLSSDYEPVEDHGVIAVEYSYEPVGSLVGFEAGFMGSYAEELIFNSSTAEFYAGVKKTFRREDTFQPHVGLGLSAINARVEALSAGEDDTGFGGYAHGGGTWMLGQSFHLGVDLRGLFGTDLTIAGFDTDADYFQVALVLGWLL
jgi:hypothetical protein